MNINCIGEKTLDFKNLEDVLTAHDCRNEVTFPTRVSSHSSTALDHAYTNVEMAMTQNSCRTMWHIVNKERGKNVRLPVDFTELVVDSNGVKYSTKKEAVDAMNARFVGAAMACGAPRADLDRVRDQLSTTSAPADRSIRLMPFTCDEVYTIITSRIPHKTSKDIYGVSMDLLNAVAGSLSPVLTHLYNLCLRDGSCPKSLKISKVSPLFKGKGKRECEDAYRPVSIIPCVAKVLENGLCQRLTAFLNEINTLSDRQYAYRSGRCTTDLAREAIHKVMDALERKQQVAMLCCDLSKAFDVADHDIIAAKLLHYGIRGKAHSLLPPH
ncbi:uncharacterized protein LOC134806735 [Cydia splendana]|uniref:uncharacterized protein LOC134806735 n=1 Tax=Cydia splendana TaxID=1100963 RepID=UPI00300D897E